jgi:hypothetical protein
MARMRPLDYAKKYWELEVPIMNDDNEIVRYEKVKFGKYRLYQGWNPNNVGGSQPPPGQTQLTGAIGTYALNLFKQKKSLELRVKNIWGYEVFMRFKTWDELRPLLPRATQAFSGKGSPEDVQLTLQLAARCGVVAPGGLQHYCDERVDTNYPRLGLDCNGFVGNYLRYRNSETLWSYIDPVSSSTIINGDMGINSIVTRLGTQPVTNEDDMFTPRMHVLAMVNNAGTVIDGGFGPVGHIMIFEQINSGKKQSVFPPIPKEYLKGKYLWYSGVEATPAVGLSRIAYAILKIAANGVATVWRSEVNSLINVKIYPAF